LTCTHQFIQKVQYQNYAEHARPDIRNTEDELARTLEYSLDVVPKTGERVVSGGFIGNVGVQHVSLNMDFASEKTEENVTIITVWELVLGGIREKGGFKSRVEKPKDISPKMEQVQMGY
jgi:hypothetical protein